MAATIITTEDLKAFKVELITELLDGINTLLNNKEEHYHKKWLKSPEVRELLGISSGTLQHLRLNGTIPYSKVGGVLYYDYQDIMMVLEQHKVYKDI